MRRRRTGSVHRWLLTTVAVLTLLAAGPVAAWAGDWQDGDVGVVNTASYRVYDNGVALRESISQGTSGSPAGCAFDRSGVLHTINSTNGWSSASWARILTTGSPTSSPGVPGRPKP